MAAETSGKLSFAEHWRRLESYLMECEGCDATQINCGKSSARGARPCFNWKASAFGRPFGHTPSYADALAVCGCAKSQMGLGADAHEHCGRHQLQHLPGNGTLAAGLLCTQLLGSRQRRKSSLAPLPSNVSGAGPGVLILGDAPGVVGLVSFTPELEGRVVHSDASGAIGHVQFNTACAVGEPRGHEACPRSTADPQGSWSRTAIDFYVGGLVDAFVGVLDTTFVHTVLLRSMICCGQDALSSSAPTVHFHGSSTGASDRDHPMEDEGFLQVLMHRPLPPT